jgi:hypothetical protein
MAAANESQGLKIALAALIALAVILMVTSYLLYSENSKAEARLQTANDDKAVKEKAANLALTNYEEMRGKIGTKATEADAAKEEITQFLKKNDERVGKMVDMANAAVAKAQGAGAQGPELEEAKQNIQKVINSYRSETNKNFMSSLDRLTELMENLSALTTELSVNYLNLRQSHESSTTVNKVQVDVQTKAASEAHDDVLKEQKKHEDERQSLVTRVEKLTTDNDGKTTEITNLTTKLKQQEEDFGRQRETLTTIIREQRDRIEKQELILDRPDGYVTYVDYERNEVLVNLTRRQGARPQMKMTIFDARSPGIPTEKPKGNIELTSIGDQFSTGRIVKTDNPIDPIRVGDIVYSAAWSPNQPMRFALVGKIDVNRDDKDDRDELKRMIQEAGGVVDFDLPPSEVGKETGTLSPRIDWYVTDERLPLREMYKANTEQSVLRQSQLEKRMGEVIKEARLNGIRPMPIQRLLAFLGYDMSAPVLGRPEAVDYNTMRRITSPRRTAEQPAAKPAGAAIKADTKAAEPKADEEMKDDNAPESKPKAGAAKKKPATKKSDDDADPQ